VHFAGPTVLVVSDEEGMRLAMTQAARPVVEGPLKATLGLVETSKSQVIVGLYPAGGGMEGIKNDPQVKFLADLKAARFTLDADEKEATLKGVATVADKEAAETLQGTLNLASGLLKVKTFFMDKKEKKTSAAVTKFLGAVKTDVKGSDLHLTVKTDPATMATATTYLGQEVMKQGKK
jgi:hypothetical protein